MKLSARNTLAGVVKHIDDGAVDTEIEIAPGVSVISIITKSAAHKLGLKVGGMAYAVIKASSVMVGVD
ncbi:MAG TPA: TOBE domain-containing protein [Steroidobacteraceae bacterium]|jgi:molybdate transport system regulatory protein